MNAKSKQRQLIAAHLGQPEIPHAPLKCGSFPDKICCDHPSVKCDLRSNRSQSVSSPVHLEWVDPLFINNASILAGTSILHLQTISDSEVPGLCWRFTWDAALPCPKWLCGPSPHWDKKERKSGWVRSLSWEKWNEAIRGTEVHYDGLIQHAFIQTSSLAQLHATIKHSIDWSTLVMNCHCHAHT